MNSKISNSSFSRFLILVCIVSFFSLGDYSSFVYTVKVISIVGLLFLQRRLYPNLYMGWIASFIILCSVSILWSYSVSNSVFYISWALQAMMVAYAICVSISSEDDIDYVLRVIFIAGVVLCIRVIIRTNLNELGSFRLGTNMGYNSNDLSLKASIACVLGFYLLNKRSKFSYRVFYALFSVALFFVVVFTGSRKGIIMVMVGLVLFALINSKSPVVFIRNLLFASIFIGCVLYMITSVDIIQQVIGKRLLLLLGMFDSDAYVGNSIRNRLNLITVGMELFERSPIFGYGIGGFIIVSGTGLYAHNNYIQLLVDLGLVGLVSYYILPFYNLFYTLKLLTKNRSLFSLLLSFSVMIFVLEYGLVTFQCDYAQLILGLSYASIRIYRKRAEFKGDL